MNKGNDLAFQDHAIEITNVTITIGFLDPEIIPTTDFTETYFGWEVKNPRRMQLLLLVVNFGRTSFVV